MYLGEAPIVSFIPVPLQMVHNELEFRAFLAGALSSLSAREATRRSAATNLPLNRPLTRLIVMCGFLYEEGRRA